VAKALGPAGGAVGGSPLHSGDGHQASRGRRPGRTSVRLGTAAGRGRRLSDVGSLRSRGPSTRGTRGSLPPRPGWRTRSQRNSRDRQLPRITRHGELGMTVRTLAKKLSRLEALARRQNDRNSAVLQALAEDPVRILTHAGLEADPWQAGVLR